MHRTRPLDTNELGKTKSMSNFHASLAWNRSRRALDRVPRPTKSRIRSIPGSTEDHERFKSCIEHVPWLPMNSKRPKRCGTSLHHWPGFSKEEPLIAYHERQNSRIRSTPGSNEDHQRFKSCIEHVHGLQMNSKRPKRCGSSLHHWPGIEAAELETTEKIGCGRVHLFLI